MSDKTGKISELRKMDARRADLWLEVFEEQFTRMTDEMREIREGQQQAAQMNDRLLKKEELAERLQVSISTISKLQTQGLPSMPCLKAVRFEYREVLDWIRSRRQKIRGNEQRRMVA